jgi:hypothetical protein
MPCGPGVVFARSLVMLRKVEPIHRRLSWSRGSLSVGSENYVFTTGSWDGLDVEERPYAVATSK